MRIEIKRDEGLKIWQVFFRPAKGLSEQLCGCKTWEEVEEAVARVLHDNHPDQTKLTDYSNFRGGK
jgi:hypothetical protein|tara:strand:- start:1199 stop:1396 length:198 start_codon:yes stop_codon:yes gene_type:complete